MSETVSSIELVVFEIGGVRYATDIAQVLRIDSGKPGQHQTPLGKTTVGARTIVCAPEPRNEASLPIDHLLGVRTVSVNDLRRLPAAAGKMKYAIGAWIDADVPVLLIDLHTTCSLMGAETK